MKIFVRVIFLIPLIGYHRLWDGEYSAIYVFSLSLYRLIWEQKQRVAMELCLQSSRCPTNRAGPRQQARGGRFPCGVPTLTAGDAGCWIPILLFQSVPSLLRLGAQPFNYSRMGKCLLPDAGFVFYPKEQNPGRWDSTPRAARSLDACRSPTEGPLQRDGVQFKQHREWLEEEKKTNRWIENILIPPSFCPARKLKLLK